jgi:Cu/Ag efflux protein CusF
MNMKRRILLPAIFALSSLAATLAHAASSTETIDPTNVSSSNAPSSDAASLSEGEVKKVDKEAGKITIKHGELKNLSMPAMTMVFRVKDPAMLERIKAGDKISFVAEKVGGQFTVTSLETTQ